MICLNGEINFEIIIMTLQDDLTNRQILLYRLMHNVLIGVFNDLLS